MMEGRNDPVEAIVVAPRTACTDCTWGASDFVLAPCVDVVELSGWLVGVGVADELPVGVGVLSTTVGVGVGVVSVSHWAIQPICGVGVGVGVSVGVKVGVGVGVLVGVGVSVGVGVGVLDGVRVL